ncbi:hypothetical protein [Actinocatenispora rupis]|uniref:Uncharacterized protein n=1 Tax=Actinocatenispora rupis TaxID=519421 RepID=A0A8J3N8H2_9ACTN|nr:hypothetical protein [Actinocatenispora rupis]GID10309.1 hypothetical protein Aru02nite_11980 [Actinocatenispora rupis]
MTTQDADSHPVPEPRVDRDSADAGAPGAAPLDLHDDDRHDDLDDETRDPETGLVDEYHVDGGPVRPADVGGSGEFPLWPDGGRARAATLTRPESRPVPFRAPRRPGVGLPLLVVFALLAAFFAWVGAEPFWLAVGHADRGTVTVTRCTGHGVLKRCVGDFAAGGDRYRVRGVPVSGGDAAPVGVRRPARMVSQTGRQAYVGDSLGLLLRWAVPLALVLVLGLLIALATGAWRLRGRQRAVACTLSMLGPLVITAGLLAAAW